MSYPVCVVWSWFEVQLFTLAAFDELYFSFDGDDYPLAAERLCCFL